jgi:isoleucyl-tRNA synthetase
MFFIPLWNAYSFFVNYANIDHWLPGEKTGVADQQLSTLDKWILARKAEVTATVNQCLQEYDARSAALALEKFVDDLSNWYVRRSRRRFWRSEADADKQAAYATLYEVLTTLCRLIAPFTPFVAEVMWQNLANQLPIGADSAPNSVHHQDYPQTRALSDEEKKLLRDIAVTRTVVNLGHSTRSQSKVKVRQPLARAMIVADEVSRAVIQEQAGMIADELNVKEIEFVARESDLVTYKIMPDNRKLGPKYGADFPKLRAALNAQDSFAVAAAAKSGQGVELHVNGSAVTLAPEDILVQAVPREGLVVAGQDGIVVALDTHLTEALVNEGLAREVVRRVNDLRKEAGLELTDRIVTCYEASPKLQSAIKAFAGYVSAETLSVDLRNEPPAATSAKSTDSFDGESLTIGIAKA